MHDLFSKFLSLDLIYCGVFQSIFLDRLKTNNIEN